MGFSWGKFFDVLKIVGPMVLMVVPGGAALAPLAPLIISSIGDAENKPGASGTEKKAYVIQLVNDSITGTNLVKPGTLDAPTITAAADEAVDTVINVVNAIQVAHQNSAIPSSPAIAIPSTPSIPLTSTK